MIRPGDSILIACEASGVVRDAFIRRGIDAWSCDLKPSEGRQANHLQGDVRDALAGNLWRFDAVSAFTDRRPTWRTWAALIAFPDCTFLCSSGLHWNRRRPERAAQTADALAVVRLLLSADIPLIALENPVGRIGAAIRKADQIIQPYQFGHDASKQTALWLKGLPALVPTQYIRPRLVADAHGRLRPRWANQTDSGQNRLAPSPGRATERARTYEGIAEAMAEQWTAGR